MPTRTLKKTALLALMLAGSYLAAVAPAFAWNFDFECRGDAVTWNGDSVTFRSSIGADPATAGWRAALEAARDGWSDGVPNGAFSLGLDFTPGGGVTPDNRASEIGLADLSISNALSVVTVHYQGDCWLFGSKPKIVEVDIFFDSGSFWDHSVMPSDVNACTSPLGICNFSSALVALGAFGTAVGLDIENGVLGTMNSFYPGGGPIGNNHQVQPHADDVGGYNAAYGFEPVFGPRQRDVAAHAFRRTGPGQSEPIPAPDFERSVPHQVQFSIENRGPLTENGVRVDFYLSTDDVITTSDIFVGSTTLNMPPYFTGTLTANVTIPASVQPDDYYFGWVIDANSQIAGETSETNNAVSYQQRSAVTVGNRPPTACFTANQTTVEAPAFVQLDAGCSSDPDGTISQYTWDFDNGATGSGRTTSAFFSETGSYRIELFVRDNEGRTATTFRTINVFGGDCVPGTICIH